MYILFLLNADVERSSKRLSIIDVYLTHLTDNSSAHSDGTFVVRNCTGRQKRLVAYHKIFRHIFVGKGECTGYVENYRRVRVMWCRVGTRTMQMMQCTRARFEAGQAGYNLADIVEGEH